MVKFLHVVDNNIWEKNSNFGTVAYMLGLLNELLRDKSTIWYDCWRESYLESKAAEVED